MIGIETAPFFSYYNILLLIQAVARTLALTIGGCGLGYLVGFVIALLRVKRVIDVSPLRWLVVAFVEFLRRIPFLVLLFLVLFAFQATEITLSSIFIAGVAIALRTAVISSENVRAAIESVHKNQWDTALSMNISRLRTLRHVVLPQAFRVLIVPSLVQIIQLLKATSIASQLGVIELTYAAKILTRKGYSAILCYGVVLVTYYVLCLALERFARRVEARYGVSRSQGT